MILIKQSNGNAPLIAALYRANIGQIDKVLMYGEKHSNYAVKTKFYGKIIYDWEDGKYHGAMPYTCRGLWIDPTIDREKFIEYIATAPERKDYPNGKWVTGTNAHNSVTIEDFDRAVKN